MIGQAGIGKSHFWSCGEKTLFIDTEGNIEHLEVMKLACRSWDNFLDIGTALIQAKQTGKMEYDTIVIDTLDKWADYASEEIISRARVKYDKAVKAGLEINTLGDIPEGNGWFGWKGLISNYLDKLVKLDCAVVLIGHTQIKEINDPVKKYMKNTINIGGQLGIMLLGWANHILNVEGIYQGQNMVRTVYARPSQSREAKSHGPAVADATPWGSEMPENYKKFRALFE